MSRTFSGARSGSAPLRRAHPQFRARGFWRCSADRLGT